MRTKAKHEIDPTTVEALHARRQGLSLRALAKELGYFEKCAPTLGSVLKGEPGVISAASERELRVRLGLPARTGKPAHRPYITSAAKWDAYREWSAQYDAQEGEG